MFLRKLFFSLIVLSSGNISHSPLPLSKIPISIEQPQQKEAQKLAEAIRPAFIKYSKQIEDKIAEARKSKHNSLTATFTDSSYADNTFSTPFAILMIVLEKYFVSKGYQVDIKGTGNSVSLIFSWEIVSSNITNI